jgi:hypothetical protein
VEPFRNLCYFLRMADGFGTQPQFDTAEFKNEGNACAFCKTALSAGYYRVQGKLTCANCMQKIQNSIPKDSHAAFVRALICGGVGALIGLALYAGVEIVTNFTIGYLALAVGYIVAKAMMMGSKNIGGRRYQIAAVLLTYFAISMAAVPVGISMLIKERKAEKTEQVSSAPAKTPQTAQPSTNNAQPSEPSASGTEAATQQSEEAPAPATEPKFNLWRFLGTLLYYGLASPFLELSSSPGGGAIGLIILFVGLNIAWRMTAGTTKLQVEGPY